MKILFAAICVAVGYSALRLGLIPEGFAWETGFVVAIPSGLMIGWWLGGKLNNVQGFMFVLVGVSALVFSPAFFGWMTVGEIVQDLQEYGLYIAEFILVAFVAFALADRVNRE